MFVHTRLMEEYRWDWGDQTLLYRLYNCLFLTQSLPQTYCVSGMFLFLRKTNKLFNNTSINKERKRSTNTERRRDANDTIHLDNVTHIVQMNTS